MPEPGGLTEISDGLVPSPAAEPARAGSSRAFKLAVATYAVLALELTLIRWMSQQIRIFAYLNNILLMASFLGLGLGVALARRRPGLIHATLPSLAALAAVLAYSRELKLLRLSFPDLSISLWGGEILQQGEHFAVNVGITMLLFLGVVWVFLCLGAGVGALFASLPPLRAYTADLAGSLCGVIAIALVSAASTSPPVWFLVAAAPILLLSPRLVSLVSLGAVVLLAFVSIQGAGFSPYNRIDLRRMDSFPGRPLVVVANRDAHQNVYDLSDHGVADVRFSPQEKKTVAMLRYMYDLPFNLTRSRESVVIVGAGTGNDVAAALRNGYRRVVSIDIDPAILGLGRILHPEHPYQDARVVPVVNDARAFFEQHHDEQFDVVCFGLVDSHAMFSAMSSLRLDNYVYTVEALRSAWARVRPGGVMTISFSTYAGEWIPSRIHRVILESTGRTPDRFQFDAVSARTFVVTKDWALHAASARLPYELSRDHPVQDVAVTSDDWPFLYIRPGVIPWGYLSVVALVLVATVVGSRLTFGRDLFGGGFHPALFAMGAGFLLIETRGVTTLSLLFGSTWIVNAFVFGGVLLIVLVANLAVQWRTPDDLRPWFGLLLLSLAATYLVPTSALLRLGLLERGLLGGLLNALPVGFAGIIFSSLLKRSSDPASALGSNLVGAIVGGCLEYVSMFTGLRALSLLAIAIYLLAFLFTIRWAGAGAPREA
ncbi:MAG: hypothetical protein ABIT01_12685 [Thermoanaerobaculia bacterium]